MEHQNLVRMANQIAVYFKAYPEDEAVEATLDHIRQFWDPRMRAGLLQILETGGAGLSETACAAAKGLAAGQVAEAGHVAR